MSHLGAPLLVAAVAILSSLGCRTQVLSAGSRSAEAGAEAPPATATGAGSTERVLTLVATSEIHGTPEPCGCQSDPVGDVARIAGLVEGAKRKGGALLVDAGGLRYGVEPIRPEQRTQAELKARFLEQAFADLGALVGLGAEDLTLGTTKLPPGVRLASNVSGISLASPTVHTLGGVKVGVFGVLDPARPVTGVDISDPVAAARIAVAALRSAGAEVVVALAHLSRTDARRLAQKVAGITVVVAGQDCGDDGAEAEQVGDTILVQPADQGQRAALVELHLPAGSVAAPQLLRTVEDHAREIDRLTRKLDGVGKELARLSADPGADPSFVAGQRAEQQRLTGERERLRSSSENHPAGAYATAALVPIRRKLPRDPSLAAAMKRLDASVGDANRSEAATVAVPAAAPGEAHYVGVDECELCHEKAVKWWKGTVHARAWNELVTVDKQWSYDCIGCHVTGYGRPGGSAMAHVDKLTDVQCEVCHGPGSLHVDQPKKVRLERPVPSEKDCKQCHTKDHSDTFQLEPYLRDVLGPGHGEKRLSALGPGPTGHELRHTAIDKAKAQ